MKKLLSLLTIAVIAAFIISISENALSQGHGNRPGRNFNREQKGHRPGGFWAKLTAEQREAIHNKIKEMRDQDASREEIKAAVAEMLKGYGIELAEDWDGRGLFHRRGHGSTAQPCG